ncbi:unnamed protein product [Strongylus vulgaris]|uniref:Uncharacterized protein n=1 Tax=Strongylus vulgaris TaxID=40348 RepID=A0A3P7IZ46_STRVU|nr:unnamed protein product [Strongylus vulgaris]
MVPCGLVSTTSVGENVVDVRMNRTVGQLPSPPAVLSLHEVVLPWKSRWIRAQQDGLPFSFRNPDPISHPMPPFF